MAAKDSPYRLTIDLNVLDHLADGLYSSVAAVLTEAVANAWDADADLVEVVIDLENDCITIKDDGCGMDEASINDRYLHVGYRKRSEEESTPKGRIVMGRKGIGKLSLFSIADEIRLVTRTNGADAHSLMIDVPEMRKQIKEYQVSEYRPKVFIPSSDLKLHGKGTLIELRRLKKNRLTASSPQTLRRRVARRFTVIGSSGFRVTVNGEEVAPNDREDLKFSQYIWKFGGDLDSSVATNLKREFELESRMDDWDSGWQLRGWIGTVDRPKQLSTPEGNLNSVIVLSRGRLVDEDILPRISNAELYTKYVTGQIEADFLDESDLEDIVTSDRQRLREDDERVRALLVFAKKQMRIIGDRWLELRSTDKTDELRAQYPGIDKWLGRLEPGWQTKAERLLGRIATMDVSETDDPDESRRELVRHAIYGFERLRLRGNAEALDDALGHGLAELLQLLADRDALEAAHYRDIVSNRLEVIREFEKIVDDDQKERVLQDYLFDHLWLLDPAWERAAGNETMEERLKLKKPFFEDDETKESYGRVDIRYRTVAGKQMIVELKRRSATPTVGQLVDQVGKYVEAFREIYSEAKIEAIIVVGRQIPGAEDTLQATAPGSKVVSYDELIVGAQQSYGDYLERTQQLDFIDAALAPSNGEYS